MANALRRSVSRLLERFWPERGLNLTEAAKAELAADRRGLPQHDPGALRVVETGLTWLAHAQDNSITGDGGVARHYSLISGWGASYPETTGYIIPTLLKLGDQFGDEHTFHRARRMIEWLISIQFESGAFQGGTIADTPVRPVTFNTGQILLGLSAGHRRFGVYDEPMTRAADWLARTQDPDGCWRLYPSPFAGSGDKSYDTHVAWGLLEAARLTGKAEHADAALSNIRWAISRQLPNGWIADCCLGDPLQPLTHTLGYALRGIIEGYLFFEERELLTAAKKTANGLLNTLSPDGSLSARFDNRWRPTVSGVCVTGSSQVAHCWLQLYQITGDNKYLKAACQVNSWVRRLVKVEGPDEVRGGARGSFPVNYDYCSFEYPNWATKFTVDSNALELEIQTTDARALNAVELKK